VSDEEQRDAIEQEEEGADVEGHSLDSLDQRDALEQRDATEEPPDVEGHSLDAPAAFEQRDA
jgi:hypothetical protein